MRIRKIMLAGMLVFSVSVTAGACSTAVGTGHADSSPEHATLETRVEHGEIARSTTKEPHLAAQAPGTVVDTPKKCATVATKIPKECAVPGLSSSTITIETAKPAKHAPHT
ncbi:MULTISPECIES: hypothetical protein [Streptomyces]|uniref:hypothetical protein n=1 Tax=Streptomyces TaxID=1883 RepID=UPI0028839ECF|nr:hypothetical protein [Streptomyces sp. DSM 41859]MDT0420295.1 hypothetical protein [Streptomyces sp. DSM 41859]